MPDVAWVMESVRRPGRYLRFASSPTEDVTLATMFVGDDDQYLTNLEKLGFWKRRKVRVTEAGRILELAE